jgi:hypothetical protein
MEALRTIILYIIDVFYRKNKGGRIFPASGVRARSGGMSKTTANIIKKHAMLAGHRMGSGPLVSAQEVVAATEHQGSGTQREPGRNVHAVW